MEKGLQSRYDGRQTEPEKADGYQQNPIAQEKSNKEKITLWLINTPAAWKVLGFIEVFAVCCAGFLAWMWLINMPFTWDFTHDSALIAGIIAFHSEIKKNWRKILSVIVIVAGVYLLAKLLMALVPV